MKKYFVCILLLVSCVLLTISGTPQDYTHYSYNYVPAGQPLVWARALAQGDTAEGNFYYEISDNIDINGKYGNSPKGLYLGSLYIGNLDKGVDNGDVDLFIEAYPSSPIEIKGSITDYRGKHCNQYLSPEVILQYHAQGISQGRDRVAHSLSEGNPIPIHLRPSKNETEIEIRFYLLIKENVGMKMGELFPIKNLSDYVFRIKDKDTLNPLTDPTYLVPGSRTTDSITSGVKEEILDATTRIFDYRSSSEVFSNSEVFLKESRGNLEKGIDLFLVQTEFSSENTGGNTKSLRITLSHDDFSLKAATSPVTYPYILYINKGKRLYQGNVQCTYDNNGEEDINQSLSYLLSQSGPLDVDKEVISFKITSDFTNAASGLYVSTVIVTTKVE